MATLVNDIKKRYPDDRIIIFDAPPVMYADPLVLSRYVDGVLLVVEHQKTTSQDINRALELLKGCNIMGTILNKSKLEKPTFF